MAAFRTTKIVSFSESSEESDNDDDLKPWRRQTEKEDTPSKNGRLLNNMQHNTDRDKSKRSSSSNKNNIWSNVMTEQLLLDSVNVGSTLETFSRKRGSESYNYQVSQRDPRQKDDNKSVDKVCKQHVKDRLGAAPVNSSQEHVYDITDIEDRMASSSKSRKRLRSGDTQTTQTSDNKKLRNSSGQRKDEYINVTESEPIEIIVNAMSINLSEPKIHLLTRIVEELGKRKALDLMAETRSIEESGGLMVNDNSRRRTPGGVYLFLLRCDRDITKEMKDRIFEQENQGMKLRRKKAKAKRNTEAERRKKLLSYPNETTCIGTESSEHKHITLSKKSNISEGGQPVASTSNTPIAMDEGELEDGEIED